MLSPDLKFYDVSRDGWIGVTYSLDELTARLQWSEVCDDDFLVIDSEGWFYEAEENDEAEYGYEWHCTDRQNVDIKVMLAEHAHGEQLSEAELDFCR
jgi:hypothetical protein